MTPRYQKKVGPRGDCFAACLATVLEDDRFQEGTWFTSTVCVADDEVSASTEVGAWVNSLNDVLRERYDAAALVVSAAGGARIRGYAIASLRPHDVDRRQHVVVFYDGRLVWDPSPEPVDMSKYDVDYWIVIHPRDPSRLSRVLTELSATSK